MAKIGLKFQCGACLELTKISVLKPGSLRPTVAMQTCDNCGSKSHLYITREERGKAVKVKSLEVYLTPLGRKCYDARMETSDV